MKTITARIFICCLLFLLLSQAADTTIIQVYQHKAHEQSYYNPDSAKMSVQIAAQQLEGYLSFDFHNVSEVKKADLLSYELKLILKQLHVEAIVTENAGDFNTALEQNFFILKLCDELRSKEVKNIRLLEQMKAMALGNIGGIYMEMEDADKALRYYFSSNDIFEKQTNSQRSRAINLSNIAGLYEQKQQVDSALYFYD